MKLTIYVVLSAILLVRCSQSGNDKQVEKFAQPETSVNTFTVRILDSLCSIAIDKNSGEFIKSDEAWGKLELYKKFRERTATVALPYDRKTDVYGFVFGVEKLRKLVEKIDSVNRIHKDTLVGVRVYYARTRNHGQEIPDVFLVPVHANKRNVYNVDDNFKASLVTEKPLVLNTSVPCPNQCN